MVLKRLFVCQPRGLNAVGRSRHEFCVVSSWSRCFDAEYLIWGELQLSFGGTFDLLIIRRIVCVILGGDAQLGVRHQRVTRAPF